jgi:lauroyl/myristoyl acyltransferase
MEKRKQYDISKFFQSLPIVWLVKYFPLFISRKCIYLLGFLYFLFNFNDRKKITTHTKKVLKNFSHYKIFLGIFDHYFEKLVMGHRPLSELISFLQPRFDIKNKNYLYNTTKTGDGCIFITGHFGAVEFLSLGLAINGYKLALICKFKTKQLKKELIKKARQFNMLLIDAAEPDVAFKALKAIKEGRVLITVCDEFSTWLPNSKEHVLVFGKLALKDKTLDILYNRAKVPVIFGVVVREKDKFVLHLDSIVDNYKRMFIAKKVWYTMEKYILKYPQQWYQWGQ